MAEWNLGGQQQVLSPVVLVLGGICCFVCAVLAGGAGYMYEVQLGCELMSSGRSQEGEWVVPWFCSVVVSTVAFDSINPSSNLGRTVLPIPTHSNPFRPISIPFSPRFGPFHPISVL